MRRPRLYFAVTNDLTYDQRMIRICTTLSAAYDVTLVGRELPDSAPLQQRPYRQKRLHCFRRKGWLFYAEYNIHLFGWLITRRADLIAAIDLDTIMACYFASVIKKTFRVYDAHELFCEMKEVVSRPRIHRIWKWIEKIFVPRFPRGYTVNALIAAEFNALYGLSYNVISNMPVLRDLPVRNPGPRYFLYQGAVNEGRSFETLIPAMKKVRAPLLICGDGNFLTQTRTLVAQHGVGDRVTFAGKKLPAELLSITRDAWAGITLFERSGRSNYLSLANRFFDYIQAGIPQICVDFPAYREINERFEVALLVDSSDENAISAALNRLLQDESLYRRLQQNAGQARVVLNWQHESQKLLDFYEAIFDK